MASLNQDFTRSGNSVFENVYIYGNLDYQFKSISVDDLEVRGNSFTSGIATFADDVYIYGELDISYLTVKNRFNVGSGGTVFVGINTGLLSGRVGIGSTLPVQKFQVGIDTSAFVVAGVGTVGIGTTTPGGGWTEDNPEYNSTTQGYLKLDVTETIRIGRNIYDSVGSPGANDYWLKRDEYGIRWQPTPPSEDTEGIKLQDEGLYVPITGIAQTFSTLNFVQRNSLGFGTDTLVPTAQNEVTATGLATIFTNDLWGYSGEGANASIYRQTNVGILTVNPITPFQVGAGGTQSVVVTGIGSVGSGTSHPQHLFQVGVGGDDSQFTVIKASGFVGIATLDPQYALDVYKDAYFREKLTVDKHTELNFTLNVDKATTLKDTLDVDKATTLNNTLDVDGKTTFNNV